MPEVQLVCILAAGQGYASGSYLPEEWYASSVTAPSCAAKCCAGGGEASRSLKPALHTCNRLRGQLSGFSACCAAGATALKLGPSSITPGTSLAVAV